MTTSFPAGAILVGVDGSDSSISALRRAAVIARALDRPLAAMTTWTFPTGFTGYNLVGSWTPDEDAQQVLDAALSTAFPAGRPDGLTPVLREGLAARTLIEASHDASMLVLGSRGHGGFVGLLLGSVSAACAEHAHCPVLIMHGVDAT